MQRKTVREIVRFIFHLLTRVEVVGLENIPKQGACLLAANHIALWDAPLVFALLERDDATGLIADTYKENVFFRWLIDSSGGIWINREQADLHALREAIGYLRKGGMLGVAPEGTRSRTAGLIQAKTGVAYLAEKARVPIIPIAISGTDKAVRLLARLRRSPIQVQVGEPFLLPPIERDDRGSSLERNADEIMCRIAAMLPPFYRGVYASHPRLLELLAARDQERLGETLESASAS